MQRRGPPTLFRSVRTTLRATKRLEKADYFYQKYEKPAFEEDEEGEDSDEDE